MSSLLIKSSQSELSEAQLIEASEYLKAWWDCGIIIYYKTAAATARPVTAIVRLLICHILLFYLIAH